MDKDRAKKLDTVFEQIEKQFGEGSLMKLGKADIKQIPAISTGALSIDLALGIGGIPRMAPVPPGVCKVATRSTATAPPSNNSRI